MRDAGTRRGACRSALGLILAAERRPVASKMEFFTKLFLTGVHQTRCRQAKPRVIGALITLGELFASPHLIEQTRCRLGTEVVIGLDRAPARLSSVRPSCSRSRAGPDRLLVRRRVGMILAQTASPLTVPRGASLLDASDRAAGPAGPHAGRRSSAPRWTAG